MAHKTAYMEREKKIYEQWDCDELDSGWMDGWMNCGNYNKLTFCSFFKFEQKEMQLTLIFGGDSTLPSQEGMGIDYSINNASKMLVS